MLFELTANQWMLALLAAVLIGATKAGIAGLGTIAILIMADMFGSRESSGIILPMLIAGDIMAVVYYRRHAKWGLLLKLIPPAIAGVVIGWRLMKKTDDAQLRVVIGAVVLFFLLFQVLRDRGVIRDEHVPEGWVFAVPVCVVAGIITMLMNAAGALMMVYFLSLRLEKNRFIGTMAWYFLVLNVLKVPFSANNDLITADSLLFNLKTVPAILVGGVVGVLVVKHVSTKRYHVWVKIIAAVGASRMLIKGITELM